MKNARLSDLSRWLNITGFLRQLTVDPRFGYPVWLGCCRPSHIRRSRLGIAGGFSMVSSSSIASMRNYALNSPTACFTNENRRTLFDMARIWTELASPQWKTPEVSARGGWAEKARGRSYAGRLSAFSTVSHDLLRVPVRPRRCAHPQSHTSCKPSAVRTSGTTTSSGQRCDVEDGVVMAAQARDRQRPHAEFAHVAERSSAGPERCRVWFSSWRRIAEPPRTSSR